MGHFDFSQLIKNYAETTSLIDEVYISQEAYHTAQQSSRRAKSPKILSKLFKTCFLSKILGLHSKNHVS